MAHNNAHPESHNDAPDLTTASTVSTVSRRGVLTRVAAGAATIVAATALPSIPGAFAATPATRSAKKTLTIGAKDFSESQIVAYMYYLLLKRAGVAVGGDIKKNLASGIATSALQRGDIDIFPEYTGTAVDVILKAVTPHNPQGYYNVAKSGYQHKYKLTWLDYSPMNDAQGFAVTAAASKQYGIKSIADMVKNASNIRLVVATEYVGRADGLPAVEKIYGRANFKQIVQVAGAGSLRYAALSQGRGDAVEAFTTDAAIAGQHLVALKDPKGYASPDNIAPVVRDDALSAYPAIKMTLNGLAPKITTAAITALNYQSDIQGKDPQAVAEAFLRQHGLLK